MADNINKTINIDVNVENQNLDKAAQGVEKITKSTDAHTKSLEHNKKGVLENGGAMGLLGAATGGLAMDFKDAVEAIEMTGISLKGLRGAIIATGIGALAIILLELITNWDKWIGLIDGSTAAMERLDAEIKKLSLSRADLALAFEREIGLAEAQGETEDKLAKRRDENFNKVLKSYDDEIEKINEKIQIEKNAFDTDEENLQKLEDEREKLRNDRYTAETQQGVNLAKEETRVREKKLADEKELNENLIAFIKNRTELNIKELESLLKEFDRINDAVNALDAGKYGEIYDQLKVIFDLYKSSNKNIEESRKKLEELEVRRTYATGKEQRDLEKKMTPLEKELKIREDGFKNIINPQLEEEIKKVGVLANERIKLSYGQMNNAANLNDLLEKEMILSNKMAQDDSMRKKDLDYFVEKNEDINEIYKIREMIYRRSVAEERIEVEKTYKEYVKMGLALKENQTTFEEITKIIGDAGEQGIVDNIFSDEQIAKYQEKLNIVFGYRVDMNNLTREEEIKIQDELFTINDKLLSNQVNFAAATTEVAKGESDDKLAIAQLTADKQIEISQNTYNKLNEQDEARIQHKEDMLNAEMGLAESAAGLLSVFADDSKDLMRASIIADSAIGIGKMIISNNLANIQALASPANALVPGSAAPIIAINNIATGLGIAANIAATAKALSKVGGGGADTGGVAAGAAPQAKFNIVGSSSSNQLAATIAAQQNQPVKAYVVGTDMTTQQALDRNIQKNATFL
jgi:hypothetical protein